MADKDIKDQDIISLETIPDGSKMTIEVDTTLYVRIQQVMLEGLPFKDLEHFKTSLQEVRSGSIKDNLSHHLHTMLHLCQLIEDSAKKSKLVKSQRYDLNSKTLVT